MRTPINKLRRRFLRGITLIEVLIGSFILVIAMMGTVSMMLALNGLSLQNSQRSAAVSIARRAIEAVHNQGYTKATEGTTTTYYDVYGNGGSASKVSTDRYSVATTVLTNPSFTGAWSASTYPDRLRSVKVVVSRISDGKVLETTGTYLALGGP